MVFMLAPSQHSDAASVEDSRPRGLPQGWVSSTLGETADIVRGVSFPKNARKLEPQSGYIACLRTANVQREVEWGDLWFIPEEYIKNDSRYVLPLDILISVSNSRELVGKVAQVTNLPHKSTLGAFISLLRFSSSLDAKFCYFQMASADVQAEIRQSASTTTNISNVSSSKLSVITLRVPPLPEQRRIVAEIEKQFTRLDASVDGLKRTQANLKRYRASVLKAACEGKLVSTEAELARTEGRDYEPADRLLERILAERRAQWEAQEKRRGKYKEPTAPDTTDLPDLPDGWNWATIGQLSSRIQYGTSAKASADASGTPVIRMGNIQEGDLDLSDLKYLPIQHPETQKTLLASGDLLFNRTNSSELVGKSAVYKDSHPTASFASYLIRVIFLDGLSPDYVCAYINSQHGRTYISRVKSQQVGQANVNGTKLAAMPIPLPPWAEQRRIVAEVERHLSVTQKAEAAVDAGLKRAERLRQSILKQAFSGQLVPQDPDDEPASVLLERIRAERATAEAAAKAQRKPKRRRRSKSAPARQLSLSEQTP